MFACTWAGAPKWVQGGVTWQKEHELRVRGLSLFSALTPGLGEISPFHPFWDTTFLHHKIRQLDYIIFSQTFVMWVHLHGFPHQQYAMLSFLSYLHHLHCSCIWLNLPHFLTCFFLEIDFKRKLHRITMNGNHYHLPEQKAAVKVNTTKGEQCF